MTRDICVVEVTFVNRPGGPSISVDDAIAWVNSLLENQDAKDSIGCNSLRYSTPTVTRVEVL